MLCCITPAVDCPGAEENPAPSIRYIPVEVPVDASPGMSLTAVIVDQMPLVHTRQLFPFDAAGKVVGENSADKQIEQVLANLEAVLKNSGSGLDKLVRVNVYALSTAIVANVTVSPGTACAMRSTSTPMTVAMRA